jgi:D-glycero-D-manno-heptose 1,7-bisphosphate phosphatase
LNRAADRRIAAFLDRDGTVIEDVPYLGDPAGVRLLPGAGAAISRLNAAGVRVILVTNQSGIARGFYDEEAVEAIHRRLREILRRAGAVIDSIYYCPHLPREELGAGGMPCRCRKPETGLVERARREHGLDLARSFFVGDRLTDVEVGRRMGGTGILLRTGYGQRALEEAGGSADGLLVRDDLRDAVEFILARVRGPGAGTP